MEKKPFYDPRLIYDVIPIRNEKTKKALTISAVSLFAIIVIAGVFVPFLRHSFAASDIDIDPTIKTTATTHNGTSPSVVFTDDNTGYAFYVDSNGSCVYSKTTNGGTSWGTAVTVDAQTDCLHVAVWYDQWTPGNTTGTMIHIVTDDSGNDDTWYTRLDTSNDTLTTTLNTSGANQGGSFVAGANNPAITEATDGTIYMGVLDNSDSFVLECSSSCDSNISQWTEAGPSPFTNAPDNLTLMPLPGAKVIAISRIVASSLMHSTVWDGGSWSSFATIDASAPGNGTYDGAEMGATVDRTTGDIYLVYGANVATPGTDDDIRTAVYDATGGTWTSKTNVISLSSSDGVQVNDRGITGVKISRDENSGDLYAVYTAQSTPGTAATGNVYYKKSTDGMTTWSAESSQLNTTSDDMYGARPNILSSNRIYVTWDEPIVDDLFGSTVAEITPTLTVGASGTQIATTTIPSSGFYIGGAFTLVRDAGTATVSQVTISETGSVNANANLSNLILYYEQAATCATSSLPGGATQFNAAGVSFNGSDQAVATGTMPVGTSQVCLYAKLDVGPGAGAGQTIDLEITDPATDVTADFGVVAPATNVAITGATTLPSTTLTAQSFRVYANTDAVQPTSSLAAENASATSIVSGQVVRIRANILVGGAPLATSTQAFKLQYAAKGGAATCNTVPNINFSDVGAFLASTTWRGFNNTSTADGATLTAAVLASSTVAESYAEENPTASNPSSIPVGGLGEWDFVVQDNAASSSAAYCFRVMTSGGATLDGYVNYPELDTIPAATWRVAEDTPTSTKKNMNIRLRIEISNNGNAVDSGSFQIEYATSTVGPWTYVPVDTTCSLTSAAFRECPSVYFMDLDPTHNQITAAAASFISGFMLQGTNPAPNLTLGTSTFSELEWNIQPTDAATDGQTYYFRATDAGVPIGTYSVFPQLNITAASSTFTQNYYRWYANVNALKPTDPWPVGGVDLGENTAITSTDSPPSNATVLRLRMSVLIGNATFPTSSQAFKLQYGARSTSCGAIGSWIDVGSIGSSTAWRGYNNTSTSDGTALSGNPPTAGDLVLSVSDRAGRYTAQNPSAQNPFKAAIGEDVEYDWVLQDNAASSSASYCFRMVKSSGTPLDSYTYYPTITTAGFTPTSENWRFYGDEADETPTSSLAGENVSPSNIADGDIIKLRMAIKEIGGVTGTNVKYKLQYSSYADFSAATSSLVEAGSCLGTSVWCYATSTGGNDNAVITTKVLSDASACSGGVGNGCGTHNTSGISTSSVSQAANATTEYEFTIKPSGALLNSAYYFRVLNASDNSALALSGTSSYPGLITQGTTLSFTVSGLPQGTSTNGIVTNVSTTATGIPFGSLSLATGTIAAQRLTITTNAANGYEIYTMQDQPLADSTGDKVPGVLGTNSSPLSWPAGCTSTSTGCYGYHAGSPVLAGGSTRFAATDSYAALTSTVAEVGYSATPTTSSTMDMIYRIQIGGAQVTGAYQNNLTYIVAPSY